MSPLDRLERLTDLVLVLLNANRPMTLSELADDVPGYPPGRDARRQAFERDKRLLREEGIPLLTEAVDGPEQYGYRIDPDSFYLPDLHLTPDEQAALQLAVAGVHLGDPSGRDALAKLGATGVTEARPLASFDPPRALVPLFDAVRIRASVRFRHRGTLRSMSPAGLWFRRGHWYVVGWDADRQAARSFRVDRIEDLPQVGKEGSGALPDDFDASAAVPDEPWLAGGDEAEDVELVIDVVEAQRVVDELGPSSLVERGEDGSVRVRFSVSNRNALRSWVLGLLDHVEVVGPPEVRAEIVAWLESIGSAAPPSAARVARSGARPEQTAAMAHEPADIDGAEHRGGRDVRYRLRRLMAIVGWLAKVGAAPIEEVAERFGLGQDELVRELELAACCGVPPYSPDALMEIVVTDQSVEAFLPVGLARPRRLTPAEGFALSAAAKTILAVPGADVDGSLGRAAAKLEAVLGAREGLNVDLPSPPLLPDVQALVDQHHSADIEYHSGSSDEVTQRRIDPVQVVSLDGHWYLDAFCHRAEGLRRFRVDRIRKLVELDDVADSLPAPRAPSADAFVPGPGSEVVQLELGPGAAWVVDSVPVLDSVTRPDGGIDVTLAVGGTAWFERLLLQAGPEACVVAPAEWVDVGRRAAERVLARYRG
ncbi:MAG TPA: WYL domain-containing protein [Acidimicrobiales bacterium]|nr:WYL domain-containing protein [Acidimicrobiales bacterium]